MFLRGLIAIALLGVPLLLGGCSETDPEPSGLRVVATNSILADMTLRVGGDDIALTTLVGPGTDTHTFEPAPSDSRALRDAEVVIENGFDFEPFLDDLIAAGGGSARRAEAAEGIVPLTAGGGSADSDSETDPHVWQSVANAQIMVENIEEALSDADPERAAAYRSRADAYLAELRALDREVADRLRRIPPSRRKLVTNHDTFGYLAREYGLTVVGVAIPGTSTEAADPSAAAIAELVEDIRREDVPAIFAESIADDDLVQTIAREAGVVVGGELFTDALEGPDSLAPTYVAMMRRNAATIHGALSGS
jgi:zinc/manganese transport system substrate-binding protein